MWQEVVMTHRASSVSQTPNRDGSRYSPHRLLSQNVTADNKLFFSRRVDNVNVDKVKSCNEQCSDWGAVWAVCEPPEPAGELHQTKATFTQVVKFSCSRGPSLTSGHQIPHTLTTCFSLIALAHVRPWKFHAGGSREFFFLEDGAREYFNVLGNGISCGVLDEMMNAALSLVW